jgi:hypothetical protein
VGSLFVGETKERNFLFKEPAPMKRGYTEGRRLRSLSLPFLAPTTSLVPPKSASASGGCRAYAFTSDSFLFASFANLNQTNRISSFRQQCRLLSTQSTSLAPKILLSAGHSCKTCSHNQRRYFWVDRKLQRLEEEANLQENKHNPRPQAQLYKVRETILSLMCD